MSAACVGRHGSPSDLTYLLLLLLRLGALGDCLGELLKLLARM